MQPRGVADKHAGLWREPPAGSSASRNLKISRDGSSNLPGAMCSRGVARPIISAFREPLSGKGVSSPKRGSKKAEDSGSNAWLVGKAAFPGKHA